ncbi:DoxX family membrane protein [Phenylobacterium sp.]|uniref:DoxX family membrane protein n=1 Tax=Phenylobacterium sp. TaxID=1871053 RepID=UPI00356A8347
MASRGKGRGAVGWAAWAPIGLAAGLIGLGLLSLFYRDFAMVWQPVPKSWPNRPELATASGLILLASGVMLLFRRSRPWGAALAAVFVGLWVVVLHLPGALARPLELGGWQAVCESLVIATGAYLAGREAKAGGAERIAVVAMGLCFVVFGLSHFVYAAFTTSMVPTWLPARLQLTYLTGGIHLAAGLAVIFGVQRRWAAVAEALMMTSFVLLVHIPRVFAHPNDRMESTGLFIAITLSSAVWTLAASGAARQGR